jgi:hypothetical protein
VGLKSADERAIERFLARQLSYVRNFLQGVPLSWEEMLALQQPGAFERLFQARDEYLELLKRCPAHLRDYRAREAKRGAEAALSDVPSVPVGAPRKDSLAEEAIKLRKADLSWAKVAIELNRKYGSGTTTAGAVRQLVLYRDQRRTSGRSKR